MKALLPDGGVAFIGASDDVAYGSAGEGHFVWTGGPDQGHEFWDGDRGEGSTGGHLVAPYTWAPWNSDEPNNITGTENGSEIRADGTWNDLDIGRIAREGLVIEFENQSTAPSLYQASTTYGSAILAVSPGGTTGTLAYVLDNARAVTDGLSFGEIARDIVHVGLTGASHGIDQQFQITGQDDPGFLLDGSGDVTPSADEEGSDYASGGVVVTNGDVRLDTFGYEPTTRYGFFTLDSTGQWSYSLDDDNSDVANLGPNEILTDTIHLVGQNADHTVTAEGDITITIHGRDDGGRGNSAEVPVAGQHNFANDSFGAPDLNGNAYYDVIVTSLPTSGTLSFNGEILTSSNVANGGYVVQADELDQLVYVPSGESASASFTYQLRNNNDGDDDSSNDTSAAMVYGFTIVGPRLDLAFDAPGIDLTASQTGGRHVLGSSITLSDGGIGSEVPVHSVTVALTSGGQPSDFLSFEGAPFEHLTISLGDGGQDPRILTLTGDDYATNQDFVDALKSLAIANPEVVASGIRTLTVQAADAPGTGEAGKVAHATVTITGAASLGFAIANGGDPDGDGFSSIAVSEPTASYAGRDSSGIVFAGGPTEIYGADRDLAGRAIAPAGDVNGDGVPDLIIGANQSQTGLIGKAYVVFGDPTGSTTVDLGALGPSQGFRIVGSLPDTGYSVAGIGDVNGDGTPDLLVGAPTLPGAAYVVYGHAGGAPVDLGTIDGGATGQGFRLTHSTPPGGAAHEVGLAVAAAGDVNGDRIPDFLVSDTYTDGAGHEHGAVYVVFGTGHNAASNIDLATIDAGGPAGIAITGIPLNATYNLAAASAGDVTGDGIDDIVVGVPDGDGQVAGSGAAYIIYGKDRHNTLESVDLGNLGGGQGVAIRGLHAGDHLGYAVAGAGDVNLDGYDDVIVGAPGHDEVTSPDSGAAYVILGRAQSSMPATIDVVDSNANPSAKQIYVSGSGAGAYGGRGFSVAGVGDHDGDGLPDFAYGSPGSTGQDGTPAHGDVAWSDAAAPADAVLGTAGNDFLEAAYHANGSRSTTVGGDGHDTLIGTRGNDILAGGGGDDVFRFDLSPVVGTDIVTDFTAHRGSVAHDRIELYDINAFSSFSQMLAQSANANHQVVYSPNGHDTLIDFLANTGSGSSILIKNVLPSQLSDLDFAFSQGPEPRSEHVFVTDPASPHDIPVSALTWNPLSDPNSESPVQIAAGSITRDHPGAGSVSLTSSTLVEVDQASGTTLDQYGFTYRPDGSTTPASQLPHVSLQAYSATSGGGTGDDIILTTPNGSVSGGSGHDIFVLRANEIGAAAHLADFQPSTTNGAAQADADVIDLSSLVPASVASASIGDYAQLATVHHTDGSFAYNQLELQVDIDGPGSAANFTTVATFPHLNQTFDYDMAVIWAQHAAMLHNSHAI